MFMTTITIDEKTKKMLDVFSGKDYEEKFGNLIKESIKAKIKECNDLISRFETKYKVEFEEFKELWEDGKIDGKHSYEVETDFLEWEALEMEKAEWLRLLREEISD